MEETKVIYYIDEEETPYLMKISQPPTKVSLSDFKGQLNRSYQKFFFKSVDDDFGVVKEELIEDEALLPNVNGRVVCWVVSGEQNNSEVGGGNKNDSESTRGRGEDDISIMSGTSRASSRRSGQRHHRHHNSSHHHRSGRSRHRHHGQNGNESIISSSDMGSVTDITATDVDTTSFCDSEDTLSRVSASTLTSLKPPKRKVLTKHKIPRSMSCSTMTTTTMTDASMQIVKVTLNMDTVNFLGISIVGHTNEDGSGGGIYVGSVMKGGAVAADGQIEPGDMLLEVNDVNFENMTNDDAVRTLREIVQTPGPISLMVAKCWDPEPIVPSFEPRLEPIRPIDPSAWVMQTNQHQQGDYGNYQYGRPFTGSPTLSTMTSNSSPSLNSSNPESEREPIKLTLTTPMYRIAKSLANPNSGLEVKDRVWLKMTIPKSFIGTDLVEWLNTNVEGFIDRRHARKYAALMLKHNFIRHTVNKITFSEQCYYIFGDFKSAASSLPSEFQGLTLSDSGDGDTLGPLPAGGIWGSDGEYSVPSYDYYHSKSNTNTGSSGKSLSPDGHGQTGTGSSASSSGNSHSQPSNSSRHTHSPQQQHQYSNSNSNNGGVNNHQPKSRMRHSSSMSSSSEFTSVSQQIPPQQQQIPGSHLTVQNLQYHHNQSSSRSGSDKEPDRVSIQSTAKRYKPPSRRGLGVAAHLVQSRESFQQALDNPCQYFIM